MSVYVCVCVFSDSTAQYSEGQWDRDGLYRKEISDITTPPPQTEAEETGQEPPHSFNYSPPYHIRNHRRLFLHLEEPSPKSQAPTIPTCTK